MDWNGSTRIRSEAAEALAEWKAFFARHVAVKAKELAQNSNPPGLVTLDHYRQAAVLAVQLLAIEVQDTESDNDVKKQPDLATQSFSAVCIGRNMRSGKFGNEMNPYFA